MAQLLNHVQPGQIITSDLWNLAVDAINELLQAGQTPGIAIASVAPPGSLAEPLREATLLQIAGHSFGYTVGQSSVSFEAQFGTFTVSHDQLLTGSSDTRLLLIVPNMPGLPVNGATLTLRVSNGVASDARSVFAVPLIILLRGDVFVTWRADVPSNPRPNPLVVGQPAEFAYQVTTGTNLPATLDLSVDLPESSVPLPADFATSLRIHDATTNQPVLSNRLGLGKKETRTILVHLPTIPDVLANQTFTVRVRATSGRVTGTDTRSFTVGRAMPHADPHIELRQTGAIVTSTSGSTESPDQNGVLEGTTVRIKPGWQMVLVFHVRFTQRGTYDVSVRPRSGALTGWEIQLVNSPPRYDILSDDEERFIQVAVAPSPGADRQGSIALLIRRADSTSEQSKEYALELLS